MKTWKRPNVGAKWTRDHDAVLLEKAEGIIPMWLPINGRPNQRFLAMPQKINSGSWNRAYSYNLHVEDAMRAAEKLIRSESDTGISMSIYLNGNGYQPTAHVTYADGEEWDIEAGTVAEAVCWAVWFACQPKDFRLRQIG
jgi:hypothetical protein